MPRYVIQLCMNKIYTNTHIYVCIHHSAIMQKIKLKHQLFDAKQILLLRQPAHNIFVYMIRYYRNCSVHRTTHSSKHIDNVPQKNYSNSICMFVTVGPQRHFNLYSKVHGANMGPTWVLSAPDGPHVGPINLAIRVRRYLLVFVAPFSLW